MYKEKYPQNTKAGRLLRVQVRLLDNHITEDIIAGSADVKALFPTLGICITVEKVFEVFYASSVQFTGEDAKELGLTPDWLQESHKANYNEILRGHFLQFGLTWTMAPLSVRVMVEDIFLFYLFYKSKL